MNDNGAHLVVGATSEIGRNIALELAKTYRRVIVAARDAEELEILASDLRVRTGATVVPIQWEATAFASHGNFLKQCIGSFASLDGITLCHGFMAPQQDAEHDWRLTHKMIDVNFTAAVSVLNLFAEHFQQQRDGYICGISSVAGDRGRQSNYLYGATKAAFSAYLAGLRNRLYRHGVTVVTVKPGFVDTSMSWGLLSPNSRLVAPPSRVARDTLSAIRKRKNVVYTPWFWAVIMLIIRLLPEWLFKRLSL